MSYIIQTNITVHGVTKNALIISSSKTVKTAEISTRDATERKTKIAEVLKGFVKLHRKGVSETTLGSLLAADRAWIRQGPRGAPLGVRSLPT